MPWCEPCGRFYNPNTLNADGTCPQRHRVAQSSPSSGAPKVPWHFWVLVVGVVGYLAWRLIQGIGWLIG